MSTVRFHLNDQLIEDADVSPTTTLLNYLRRHRRLTGTKEGCAEGDCGACTVVMLDAEAPGGARYRAVNACLMFLPMVQGRRIYTVEGLAQDGVLHPAQAAMVRHLGSQCGYCTPGVVMAAFEACYRKDLREPWQLDDQMCGNLCRCTGYRPIRDAVREVAGTCPEDPFSARLAEAGKEVREFAHAGEGRCYVQPTSLEALWAAMQRWPQARIVCGGTDLALIVTQRYEELPQLISVEGVPELGGIGRTAAGEFRIGATTTLADLEAACLDALRPLTPLLRIVRYFASRQIKHRATVGGNLCNASPIGDLAPVLLALGADVVLRSAAGERRLPLEQFFVGYRKTALQPGEVLAAVIVPEPPPGARMAAYKVSKRRELDISAVAAGMYVETCPEGKVKAVRAAFGGMAATPARARGLEAALLGRPWTTATVEAALPALGDDFRPISDHRGSSWYRRQVAENLVRGFYLETLTEPRPELPARPSSTVRLEVAP